MSTALEIPLSGQAQTFSITLAGTEYQLTFLWRDAAGGGWVLDLADAAGNQLLSGIPLITGVDLLAQYSYLNIPGQLWVMSDGDPAAVPTYSNLGSTSHLYFVTT